MLPWVRKLYLVMVCLLALHLVHHEVHLIVYVHQLALALLLFLLKLIITPGYNAYTLHMGAKGHQAWS